MKWIYLTGIVILAAMLLILYFQNVFILGSYGGFFFFSYIPLPLLILFVIIFSFLLGFLTSLFIKSLFSGEKDFDDGL